MRSQPLRTFRSITLPFARARSIVKGSMLAVTVAVGSFVISVALGCSAAEAVDGVNSRGKNSAEGAAYYPPPESLGGWRAVNKDEEIETMGGMDKGKIA